MFVMLSFAVASLTAAFAGLIFAANAMAYLSGEKGKVSGTVMCISGLAAVICAGLAVWFARGFFPGI